MGEGYKVQELISPPYNPFLGYFLTTLKIRLTAQFVLDWVNNDENKLGIMVQTIENKR